MTVPGRVRKRFGQHFLTDQHTLEQIHAALRPRPTDRLFEIGPGTGALTAVLYGTVGTYRAIEIDRDLIDPLQARYPALQLLSGDVLRADLDAILADGHWRVVGNLPYNITSPLLGRLFGQLDRIEDLHLMLQREVAMRMCAAPYSKAYGRLSVGAQSRVSIDALFDVAPDCFSPPPAVWSTVVRLLPGPARMAPAVQQALDDILRQAFSARRKRLANALKTMAPPWDELDIDPELRADQVTVAQYQRLAGWHAQQNRSS